MSTTTLHNVTKDENEEGHLRRRQKKGHISKGVGITAGQHQKLGEVLAEAGVL